MFHVKHSERIMPAKCLRRWLMPEADHKMKLHPDNELAAHADMGL